MLPAISSRLTLRVSYTLASRRTPLLSRVALSRVPTTRTFVSSTPRLEPAAARKTAPKKNATTKKTTGTRNTAATKKKVAPKKKAPKKKPGPKKKTGAAKKPAVKKVAKRIPKALKPPKSPPNPFGLFHKEQMEAGQTYSSATEALTSNYERFKALPDSEKQTYADRVKQLNKEYVVAFQRWINETPPETLRFINKVRKNLGKPALGIPKEVVDPRPKKAPNAFTYYVKEEVFNRDPSAKTTDIFRAAAQQWKQFPAAQKEKYEAMHAAEKVRYQREKAQYLARFK